MPLRCANLTTLWRALRLWAEQLPYQAVIQPDRMLSIVSAFGDKPNFFSLLRLKMRCCTFFTTLSVWVDQLILSVICTPRNLKLTTLSTTVPSMWIGGCSLSWGVETQDLELDDEFGGYYGVKC